MTPTTQTMEEAIRDEVAAETKTPTSLPPNIFEAPGPVKLQRRLTLVITLTPFVGFLLGMRLLWGGISALDLSLLIGLYSISILGVTVGYHRMLTHGGFDAPTWVRVAFSIAGSLAVDHHRDLAHRIHGEELRGLVLALFERDRVQRIGKTALLERDAGADAVRGSGGVQVDHEVLRKEAVV